MTAAFYCLLEPTWYPFQAIYKTVPGALAPTQAKEPRVCPALWVMPVGWQSACGLLLHYFHRLDTCREIRRDMPLPLAMDKSQQDFFTVYLDGFSQAELVQISELASVAEVPSATAAVHAAWTNWGIPRQLGKEVLKEDEIEVLVARVAGQEQWLARSLLCRRGFVRRNLAPSYKRKSLEDGGFELSNSAENSRLFLTLFGSGSARKSCGLAAG